MGGYDFVLFEYRNRSVTDNSLIGKYYFKQHRPLYPPSPLAYRHNHILIQGAFDDSEMAEESFTVSARTAQLIGG